MPCCTAFFIRGCGAGRGVGLPDLFTGTGTGTGLGVNIIGETGVDGAVDWVVDS